ncbi:MAG: hypothetical protein KF768_12500 [Phycisphaeraceae bacterium]|nr:hypothetical protein [Phycisphaeraceae bacterium]
MKASDPNHVGCPNCRYPIGDLVDAGKCPECGEPLHRERIVYLEPPSEIARRRRSIWLAIAPFLVTLPPIAVRFWLAGAEFVSLVVVLASLPLTVLSASVLSFVHVHTSAALARVMGATWATMLAIYLLLVDPLTLRLLGLDPIVAVPGYLVLMIVAGLVPARMLSSKGG